MNQVNNLGQRIREKRKAKAFSQGELAEKLGVSQTAVSAWEIGKLAPPKDLLSKIDEALGTLSAQKPPSKSGIGSSNASAPESIGERIRVARRANALSQSELAEKLGVSQPAVSAWEIGKVIPPKEQMPKLNEILGGLVSSSEEVTEAESQSAVSAWLSRALARKDLTVGELAARAGVSPPTVYNILGGRAQNPHPKTITALEKALGEAFESKEEAREASEIAGIGELIDFNPYDHKEIPNHAGVYVLYDISQRPIYVGKASKISTRLNDHSTRFWYKRPLVETGAYIEIKDPVLRDQIETVLIQFLKNNAVINKQKTVRDED